jgi:hypothetical protein
LNELDITKQSFVVISFNELDEDIIYPFFALSDEEVAPAEFIRQKIDTARSTRKCFATLLVRLHFHSRRHVGTQDVFLFGADVAALPTA